MANIVVDSGVLCAAFDATDSDHSRATNFLRHSHVLHTNLPVLTEVAYLLRKSHQTRQGFLKFAARALQIDTETASDLPRIVEIMAKYADLPADFADASVVALCERRGIVQIASFDSDFTVYRLANGQALANVIMSPL